jgi:methylmalonyl-CoA mutase
MIRAIETYVPTNKIRIVTATSLFDGHDVSINLVRRILHQSGAEVIHLGHNRSVREIVDCAVQEAVQGVAVTSYQGGHLEFFKYLCDQLREQNASHVKIFGGGGGTILQPEIEELEAYGVARIFSSEEGRKLGLQGMVNEVLSECDFPVWKQDWDFKLENLALCRPGELGLLITAIENVPDTIPGPILELLEQDREAPVLGITGPGGAGKSCLVDEIVRRYLRTFERRRVGIISVDPSKRKMGGALLGDRIRVNSSFDERVFMHSFATRRPNAALAYCVGKAINLLSAAGYDLIVVETAGIGQSNTEIVDLADVLVYVMSPDFGSQTQLEKIDMLDFADSVVINKFEKQGASEAMATVRRHLRGHGGSEFPAYRVFGTVASRNNDPGIEQFFGYLLERLESDQATGEAARSYPSQATEQPASLLPFERLNYLSEIADSSDRYEEFVRVQVETAKAVEQLEGSLRLLQAEEASQTGALETLLLKQRGSLDPRCREILESWDSKRQSYLDTVSCYRVRNREIEVTNRVETLSGLAVPRVAVPAFSGSGERLKWALRENYPGEFPFTAGIYAFRRQDEELTRMVVGEGSPERTNKRFHQLNAGFSAARLSAAFDPVTIYGEDPGRRPDVYGRIGNSGVSVASLDDVKILFSGFNLCDSKTSVSLIINGPAPIMLGLFLNAAIDQQCELYIREHGLEAMVAEVKKDSGVTPAQFFGPLPEGNDGLGLLMLGVTGDRVLRREVYEKIRAEALTRVRGTVQADVLKEVQAQNICLFPIDFSLRMMGDIQSFFVRHGVRNFYSISVSGYHIAEAGANPITQLSFALANAFTYVEYFLSRGMHIDEFVPNISFFFSSGLDPEYSVIGRSARRIWSKAIRLRYQGNPRSQMLKYHVQTSGRSLQAQNLDFNDIRTTLQALYSVYDNCNSLHTNAYDESVTTPTEESVRRAVAIQRIIDQEFGLTRNENPLQGSFIVEELTDLVEEAVYEEFRRISNLGGVLNAMEQGYQRNRIQEESLRYEVLRHSGEFPVVGVNTFAGGPSGGEPGPAVLSRSSSEERDRQVRNAHDYRQANRERAKEALEALEQAAASDENLLECLMETCKACTLGEMTEVLYRSGGRFKRSS